MDRSFDGQEQRMRFLVAAFIEDPVLTRTAYHPVTARPSRNRRVLSATKKVLCIRTAGQWDPAVNARAPRQSASTSGNECFTMRGTSLGTGTGSGSSMVPSRLLT